MNAGFPTKIIPLLIGLSAAAPSGFATILLDISVNGDPGASAADFTAAGVSGLTGSETVGNVFAGSTNDARTSFTFSTGETMTLSSRTQGAWTQSAETNELLADYLYLQTSTGRGGPITVSLGNLGLTANTSYTLYLFGHNTQEANQDSLFTGISNSGVMFASSESQVGTYSVVFTTLASYAGESVDFMWARSASSPSFAPLQGMAIVPSAIPEPGTTAGIVGGAVLLFGLIRRRQRGGCTR